MALQVSLLSSSAVAESGDEDTGDAGSGTMERDEFGMVNSVQQQQTFEDEKLDRWLNGRVGKIDRCYTIILGCVLTIVWYGLSDSVIYRVIVLIVAPAMITAVLIIFVLGHSHFGLSTYCVFKYAVLFRFILNIGIWWIIIFPPNHVSPLLSGIYEFFEFFDIILEPPLSALLLPLLEYRCFLFASWFSVFVIDWGMVHCGSFNPATKSNEICCECCPNDCSLLENALSCANVLCDFEERHIDSCQSASDCISSVLSAVDDYLLKLRAPMIIFFVSLISLGLLIVSELQSSDNIFIGVCSIISFLMILCVIGFLGGSEFWSYLHRFALLLKTIFLMAKYRMALRSKLTKGSSNVKFILWQALSIISALFLSWLTFTLTARFEASLDSDTLFAKLVHSSFIRNKNLLITCVCVQWLLAQCSLFLLLLPLDIYSANAHRSWLRDQYGRTIFYTQLFSLIGAKQLNLSFVEFWDDSHDDHSGRPSLSNALSTMLKCMIVSFALLPFSLYFAVSGITNHPFDKLLWINLSLPLLKFANLLVLKWVLQWNLLDNEQPKTSPIRSPNGFPIVCINTKISIMKANLPIFVFCMVLFFVYLISVK